MRLKTTVILIAALLLTAFAMNSAISAPELTNHPLEGKVQLLVKTSDNVVSKEPIKEWTAQQLKEHRAGNARQGYIVTMKEPQWYDNYSKGKNTPYWGIEWGVLEKDPKRFMIVTIPKSEWNKSWLEVEYNYSAPIIEEWEFENVTVGYEVLSQRKYRLPLDTMLTANELIQLYNIPYGQNVGWSFSKNVTNIASKVIYNEWSTLPPQFTPHGSSGNFTICPVNCDYTSINGWENGEDGDITFTGPAYGIVNESFIDNTPISVAGWTTNASSWVDIHVIQNARHNGSWDRSKFVLTNMVSQTTTTVAVSEDYIRIEGLQLFVNATGAQYNHGVYMALAEVPDNDIWVTDNIILIQNIGGGTNNRGMSIEKHSRIWNNIILNATAWSVLAGSAAHVNLYNNIIISEVSGSSGVRFQGNDVVIVAKNNIVQHFGQKDYNGWAGASGTGGWGANSDYNIADKDGTGPGTNNKSCSPVWVDNVTAIDYHLNSTDTCAIDSGMDITTDADNNISFTTDIDEETRDASWDIGADEYRLPCTPAGANYNWLINQTCILTGLLANLQTGNITIDPGGTLILKGSSNVTCARFEINDTSQAGLRLQIDSGMLEIYKVP